jgi:3-hydroxy-9,10-secoandrosta-1,3,5(10)-triene-9,17-dione monooxygenase reductase component
MSDPDVIGPDAASFRSVLGHFATGITVITAMDGDEPVGLAANSFTSVSLDPPLVLFCAAKSSTTWPRIERAGHFGQTHWHVGASGPILDDVHAFLDCALEQVVEAGDHMIVVGRVLDLGLTADAGPLLFYQGRYGRLLGTDD